MFNLDITITVAISGTVLAVIAWYMVKKTEESMENTKKFVQSQAMKIQREISKTEEKCKSLEKEIDVLKLELAMLKETVFGKGEVM